jgi:hypothetical protein
LNQCPSGIEYIQKLFWIGGATHWPETASYAASHNRNIMVVVFHCVVIIIILHELDRAGE